MRVVASVSVALGLAACGRRLVPVVPDGTATAGTAVADPTFEVIARVNGVKDPLPVAGASVAYADLQRSLAQAVAGVVGPRHDSALTVELIAGDAEYSEPRVAVSLVARATLRTRVGNTFVGQTVVVCREGAIAEPEQGGRVIWSCMTHLAHDLGGWLVALPP
jgi:hypothetical protein